VAALRTVSDEAAFVLSGMPPVDLLAQEGSHQVKDVGRPLAGKPSIRKEQNKKRVEEDHHSTMANEVGSNHKGLMDTSSYEH